MKIFIGKKVKSGGLLADFLKEKYDHCIIFQNVLQMTATHSNYVDPNNLKFEEIKILGLSQEIGSVSVSQNNAAQDYTPDITYDPATKVKQYLGNGK